jgi:hypothetical protein
MERCGRCLTSRRFADSHATESGTIDDVRTQGVNTIIPDGSYLPSAKATLGSEGWRSPGVRRAARTRTRGAVQYCGPRGDTRRVARRGSPYGCGFGR